MPAAKSCFPRVSSLLLLTGVLSAPWPAAATPIPAEAVAASQEASLKPKDLNTPRVFPPIATSKEWQSRAREIREHVLVSCGLWPMPEKAPLNSRVFDRVERDGYSIEKVWIETWPGFYLGGNLYRPLGKGKGPFPAVLNPHGHWSNGRMANEKDGSIAGRCISFARQGMIAFSYDMVGYNDTHFADAPSGRSFSDIHHQFATDRANLLWNISLMGLQTWNSIRAVDFIASLPDADPKRLACTGESGGGTQTFMLGSVENRLAAQAPVVMVSHTMQGGCLCENAPGLRVQYSNMEISAAAAPRPQILVAATGDWTKDTLMVEGPSIAHIYSLLGAPASLHYVRYNFDHNYNQTSREAVYGWFGKWLLHNTSSDPIPEPPFQKEPDADLRVFPDGHLPPGAVTQPQFIEFLKEKHRSQWQALVPKDMGGLKKFKELMLPAWRHTLQLEAPFPRASVTVQDLCAVGDFTTAAVQIRRAGETAAIQARYWAPKNVLQARGPKLVVLSQDGPPTATPSGQNQQPPKGFALELLQRGMTVLNVERFSSAEPEDQFTNFYCTYNRTRCQSRVRDLVTICAVADSIESRKPVQFRVTLAGSGNAGLWSLLAAPAAEAVVADCAGLDSSDGQGLLAPDLFCPGILALSGFQTAAMLAAPHPLLLHNTGEKLSSTGISQAFAVAKAQSKFTRAPGRSSEAELATWIAKQK